MYINGSWATEPSQSNFEIFNPATGDVIQSLPDGGREAAKTAIDAAAEALTDWRSTTPYQRAEFLMRAHTLMLDHQEDLAKVMTSEQGKPLRAAMTEVKYAADFLIWFAEEGKRIYGEIIPSARVDQRFHVLHQAVGVVAAITPWNYPISMITRKLAPALAAGCTVVLKPAEATPLTAVETFKVFERAGFPPGVVNLVTAADPKPVGEEFTTNPKVAKLTFTGSTAVGKMLAGKAAGNMKRVSCELGGHAPFLVLKDADPVHAAKGLQLVKFLNTGQACISPNRIFVHNDILGNFLKTLTSRVSGMKAGNGMDQGVTIGPLVNNDAVVKVEKQVADAVAKGAQVLCGGHRLIEGDLGNGHFFAPTVLNNVTPEMQIYREETFGPVAAIIPFDDNVDLLFMANDTHYGLAAYVYSQNLTQAMQLFEGLQFGIIGINDINPASAAAPFGGMKDSGLGREGSREGIHEYLETKVGGFSI